MKRVLRYTAFTAATLSLVFFFQNCGQPGSISITNPVNENPTGGTPIDPVITDVYGIQVLPSNKFICEPFGNMNGGEVKGGLKAELAYVNPDLSITTSVKNAYGSAEYFSGASQFVKTQTPIFLSQINVPARNFSQGFRLSDGSYLSDTQGNRLIEWFALKMKSVLKLSDADEEGDYELATISDDGSRLFIGTGNQEQEIINNDGAHSTRMICAQQPISLTKASKIPLTYYYNQGPRTEISNVLVWRKKSQSGPTDYTLCGKTSQTAFWNPADSSEGNYWKQLEADGWKVIDTKNFELPDSQVNPCATQNTNLITKAEFSALLNSSTTLNIDFMAAANIKAKLFKVEGATNTLVQAYDFSAQARDKISLSLPVLEVGATYSVEVLLEMPGSGTQVLNEVRFQIVKQ